MLVPMTGDKGLCGGCNSSIVRHVKKTVKGNEDKYAIFVLGKKGESGLLRPCKDILNNSITEI